MRPQRARRRLGGARVLARKLRVEPCPTFRRRAPRHGCQPCLRGSRLSSRVPSALSPSSPALAAHTLDQDSPADGNVSRAGDGCGVVVRVRSEDGTPTALHRRPGKEGPSPVPQDMPHAQGCGALAVAHPWASASSYLSSQSLGSPILAATFMPPRGRPTQ